MGLYRQILNESKSIDDDLYFLSKDNMDNKTLYPRIPENYFTKNGYEDNKTKRVCFATSIHKALMAISMRMKGMELYVHVPKTMNIKTYKPTTKEVPDCKITGETWITHPIGLKCIGKIKVIDDAGKDGHKFTYGEKTAELYDWNWEWVEKYDKESVNESNIFSEKDLKFNFDKWDEGKYPVLLITGLSGSGKSTLASQLANKHKAEIVELDQLEYDHGLNNIFLKKFMKSDSKYSEYNHISEYWRDKNGNTNKDKLIQTIKKYIHFCVSYAEKNNIKTVIEGIQIYQLMYTKDDLIYMTNKPIIIKGASPLIAKLRQFKRILNGGNDGQSLSTLIQDNNYLKEFRDDMKSIYKEYANFSDDIKDEIYESYNYSDKFSDVINIVNSLSNDEKYYLAPSDFSIPDGSFADSPYCIYRKVYKKGNDNMGFIELYSFEDKSKAYTALAVSPKYRGKGLSKLMVTEAINSLSNKKGLKKIIWGTIKKNKVSNKLARELNFKLFDSDDVDNEYEYDLKNNLKEEYNMGMYIANIQEKAVSESSDILNTTLYHGSVHKMNILQPTAVDIGNKLQGPGWSLFCWNNKQYAIGWVIMQCIRKIKHDIKKENKAFAKQLDCLWYIKLNKPCMSKTGVDIIKEYVSKNNVEGYVYTIKQPFYKVGIGNDLVLPEYTVRDKDIKPTNIDKIKITPKLLDEYIYIMNDVDLNEYKKDIMDQNVDKRFLSIFMIRDYNYKMDTKKLIYDAMNNGTVSVGDDLSGFVKENNDVILLEKERTNHNHYNNRRLYNDNEFGIPKLRKYPLIDKDHVLQAMRFFKKCDNKYKKELAVNIVKRARELNMGINLASDYYKLAKDKVEELPINENDNIIEEAYLLLEANSSLYKKKYQCPYCDDRYDRQKLVSHIEKKHKDFIPENYTATRIVFNLVNKKEKGSCVICGKETPWDENKEKYDRICSESCVKVYVQQRNDNMLRVRGKLYVTDDPDFQKKMLANRKISGEYIWSDGVKRTYTGSYEKKLLEFLDKVMGFKSVDVITPGDTVVYDYNGKNHMWILDCTIVPYNLQIDAKDGGDNPNNREMTEYRDKQIAKEKAILQQGQYNYLRLTNNNFSQLLTTLAQIKMNLLENNSDKIWNVNEYMAMGSCNPVVSGSSGDTNFQQKPIQYIVPAMVQNSFVEPLYARDKYLEKLYRIVDGKLVLVNRNDIKKEFDISDKLLKSSEAIDMKYDIDSMITNEEYVDHNILYEMLTGHKLLDKNQYFFDENLSVELEGFYEAELRRNILESTFSNIFNDRIIISENINRLPISYKNLVLERDCNGFFAMNINNKRTKSYDKASNIPVDLLEVLINM